MYERSENWHQLALNPVKLIPYRGVSVAQANQPLQSNPIFPFLAYMSFELDLTQLQPTHLSYIHMHNYYIVKCYQVK